MASAHAPCPRAIHAVYPDSLTRHLTCTPHPTRLLLAPTALVAVLSSAIGSFPPTLPVVQRAMSTGHLHSSSTRTHPTVTRNTTDALTPHEPSPSPHAARSFPPTCARATYSSSRQAALIRPSPAIPPTLSPLTTQARPHMRPIFPTHVRKGHVLIISSSRTHSTVTRGTTDALTPRTSQARPHNGRISPTDVRACHVPCVCRASHQHQLRRIDRSARRTRRSSVDGGRAEEI